MQTEYLDEIKHFVKNEALKHYPSLKQFSIHNADKLGVKWETVLEAFFNTQKMIPTLERIAKLLGYKLEVRTVYEIEKE